MAGAAEVRQRQRAEGLAADLPPLLVAAERVASTVIQGVHGRRVVGQGETFWQFRRYGQGDSASNIDWRRSARSRHIFVRETEWEAAQTVWLWRDTSASMTYRSGDEIPTKAARRDLLLLALAALLTRGAERFALVGAGLPPASGRAAFQRLAEYVLQPTDPSTEMPDFEALPRYAQLVMFGYFLTAPEAIRDSVLKIAGRGIRGQMVQIFDPAEEELPFSGRVRFSDLEPEGDVLVNRVEAVRETYHRRFAAHQSAVAAIARVADWGLIRHRTDQPPEKALLALYIALSATPGR